MIHSSQSSRSVSTVRPLDQSNVHWLSGHDTFEVSYHNLGKEVKATSQSSKDGSTAKPAAARSFSITELENIN